MKEDSRFSKECFLLGAKEYCQIIWKTSNKMQYSFVPKSKHSFEKRESSFNIDSQLTCHDLTITERKDRSKECRLCNNNIETRQHLLTDCPATIALLIKYVEDIKIVDVDTSKDIQRARKIL